MTELTISERVDAGVAWLNENGPSDWVDRINTSTLNVANASDCVLGQVFDDGENDGYAYALVTFDLWDTAYGMGFSDTEFVNYDSLTFHWKLALSLLKTQMAA